MFCTSSQISWWIDQAIYFHISITLFVHCGNLQIERSFFFWPLKSNLFKFSIYVYSYSKKYADKFSQEWYFARCTIHYCFHLNSTLNISFQFAIQLWTQNGTLDTRLAKLFQQALSEQFWQAPSELFLSKLAYSFKIRKKGIMIEFSHWPIMEVWTRWQSIWINNKYCRLQIKE